MNRHEAADGKLGDSKFVRQMSSVLFCDIRGFTQYFDQVDPAENFNFVTMVLNRLSSVVEKNLGRIVTLTGDGFLAVFGDAPVGSSSFQSHESNSICCATEIRREIQRVNQERHYKGTFVFAAGIGINTGPVAAGRTIVSNVEVDLVLGDVVNTASRIESLCKFFSVDILVSEATAAPVRDKFKLMPMPPKSLRGKIGEFKTFWVLPT